jgi:hypothetical protein
MIRTAGPLSTTLDSSYTSNLTQYLLRLYTVLQAAFSSFGSYRILCRAITVSLHPNLVFENSSWQDVLIDAKAWRHMDGKCCDKVSADLGREREAWHGDDRDACRWSL